jgi:hypothetical protein
MSMTGMLSRERLRFLLAVGSVACVFASAAAAGSALATNEGYSCPSCAETSGPNNYVTNNEAIDYTQDGVCSAVWKWNGGSNYNRLARECTTSSYKTIACDGDNNVSGHGEVEAIYGNNHLAGRQDNLTYCG